MGHAKPLNQFRILLFLILTFVAPSAVWATTYYVKAAGNDNADGLSDANAWATIGKVNASRFSPGDFVLFKRGDSFTGGLNPPSSGLTGSPITFGAYGSGARPVINGSTVNNTVYFSNKNYVDLVGIKVTSSKGNYNIEIYGSSHINVTDCEVTLSYHSGISIEEGSSYITVKGGTVHDSGQAGSGDQDGIGIGGNGAGSAHLVIDGVEMYGNLGTNLMIATTSTSAVMDDVTIKNCRMYNSSGINLHIGGPHTNITVAYNLIYSGGNNGASFHYGSVSGIGPTAVVYNNVIWGNKGTGLYIQNNSTITAKNNIIGQNSNYEIYTQATANLTSDYNDLYHSAGGNFLAWHTTAYNFANWKANSGQDAHSINSNPLFTNSGAFDFTLTSSSPCIGAGTNVGLTQDRVGTAVPQGGRFDIGAFEYLQVTLPGPPSNLQVQ